MLDVSVILNAGTRIPAAAMDVLDAILNASSGQKTTAWTGQKEGWTLLETVPSLT